MNSIVSLPIAAATPIASPSVVGPADRCLGQCAVPDPAIAAIEQARTAKKLSDARYARVSKLCKEAKKAPPADRDAFVTARLGCDPDTFTDETAQAYWDATDHALEISPTTLRGIYALVSFVDELVAANETTLVEQNAVRLVAALKQSLSSLRLNA